MSDKDTASAPNEPISSRAAYRYLSPSLEKVKGALKEAKSKVQLAGNYEELMEHAVKQRQTNLLIDQKFVPSASAELKKQSVLDMAFCSLLLLCGLLLLSAPSSSAAVSA